MNGRILIFSTAYLPQIGGAEIAVKELTDRLLDWEFDLICARLDRSLPRNEMIGRVRVHRIGFGFRFDKYLLPLLAPLYATANCQLPTAFIWSILASYGGIASLIYTWIHPKTKLLLTLQEGDPFERYTKHAGPFAFLHRMIFRRANAVQAISNYLGSWATQMGFRGSPVIIPNGVDIERFLRPITPEKRNEIRGTWKVAENEIALITAGRLTFKNGVDDAIRALELLPSHFKFIVVGDGEDRLALQVLVESLHIESRVVFVGKKSHDELPSLLRAADIFVRPSLSEGLGNAFLEAMAAERPVIATMVGGIVDFLKDGETGYVCSVRDPASIARAAERIVADSVQRQRVIDHAREMVKEKYPWTSLAKQMNELFLSFV